MKISINLDTKNINTESVKVLSTKTIDVVATMWTNIKSLGVKK